MQRTAYRGLGAGIENVFDLDRDGGCHRQHCMLRKIRGWLEGPQPARLFWQKINWELSCGSIARTFLIFGRS
jgi:hypothetical protein